MQWRGAGFLRWDISVICPIVVLKLALTVFSSLCSYFRTLWSTRQIFFRYFEKIFGSWSKKTRCGGKYQVAAIHQYRNLKTAVCLPETFAASTSNPVCTDCCISTSLPFELPSSAQTRTFCSLSLTPFVFVRKPEHLTMWRQFILNRHTASYASFLVTPPLMRPSLIVYVF